MSITRRLFGIVTAGIAVAVTDATNGVMAMSTNLELFKAIVERGFSQGDLSVADEVCDAELIEHQYLTRADLPGPQILKAQIEDARRSIKDLKFTIEAIVESGDTVWARGKASGVDPRSGKPVTIDVMDVCRFANGKLVEHWGYQTGLRSFISLGRYPRRPTERNLGYLQ
jgi:ketosteroid isomerase-like protein